MASFARKVVAITGAASGIGLETAKLIASRGGILSLCDYHVENLHKAEKACRDAGAPDVLTSVTNVRSSAAVNKWISATVDKYGQLDAAANIAGVLHAPGEPGMSDIQNTSDEAWEFLLSVNTTGVFNCLRAQLRNMNNGGSIVNCASYAGLMGLPGCAPYVASKHAVVGLTRAAARENGAYNIRINAVAPGAVDSPGLRSSAEQGFSVPTRHSCVSRKATPKEIAQTVVFLLSSDSSFTTGAVYPVDGGWHC
ncbi:hypothetical protein FE257_011388 [Aspergillus nanangensis]|uniref:Uncharacterized protein n=1 Tax=Aspergillus nanangensis TaxID=2582783 RepID=A0AAD4GRF3_ASPNN|nr:hypothetical protein FE257_011388 [Aspergillus nanangensis]